MKVMMLGWEYPPHIAGGLGIACDGLTKALARLGIEITFVVPQLHGGERASHMVLRDPFSLVGGAAQPQGGRIRRVAIPAMLKPYWSEAEFQQYLTALSEWDDNEAGHLGSEPDLELEGLRLRKLQKRQNSSLPKSGQVRHYGANIFGEITQFTDNVISAISREEFDVVHAHDWMTYPAGVALAELSGKPLVSHVHSVEFDRSGSSAHPRIYEIERIGLSAASAVIAVSHYTKSVVLREYGIEPEKVFVVHNGIYPKSLESRYRHAGSWPANVVLFLGRVTFQKGPGFFVRAAAKVIPHVPDALFVMAGNGDMLPQMIDLTRELGVSDHFRFPGFLTENEVEEVFSAADLYVMPSVSEPFGLSALEAINFDTPAIISKQSGVSEVLDNALKFDYWDVDRLADFIVNALQYEELRTELVTLAKEELKKVRWNASALETQAVYTHLM